jgi:hypothetical protein
MPKLILYILYHSFAHCSLANGLSFDKIYRSFAINRSFMHQMQKIHAKNNLKFIRTCFSDDFSFISFLYSRR